MVSLRLALSNPTLPEITDGYEIQLHHSMGHDQIEQDLIISRALCDLFSAPKFKGKIAFRGGTAINKLLFKRPMHYSEDIDLVQITAEPIGPTIDAIRGALAWIGKCKAEQAGHSAHLVFRFAPEAEPGTSLKLKVEINTREHASLYGTQGYPFKVENGWFNGVADIISYDKEELFVTKLRAHLQRRKNAICSIYTKGSGSFPSIQSGLSLRSSTICH
ncbi:putative nucleotidyltransferase component of viral defense system [Rhizobium pisi]|uniref:Putative nucleotidyltransferase component of viral defense system n=1 Tax=Rhizobium pisi TaxID=574561 RepID=A0A427M6U6_9HYPH|nr:putative nucleotidyltransferase component of viral defense system [Rhizobium pisi]RSB59924.1 hypothetical protein EFD55_32240 [Rhizobium pisi]